MGFSSEEFIRMREMESFRFDYYEPIVCDRHYWFDVEADSREEAKEKAKEIVENGFGRDTIINYDCEIEPLDGFIVEGRKSELFLDNQIVKSY